jgi:peptidoglycan/LPS O-acetylase OafA/YrhL
MACSLALYTYGSTFWKPLYTWCLADIVAGLASGGIIILSVSFPILEKSEILAWLGKISYSLYLMHAICLNVAYRLLIYKLPFPLLLVVMVVMSITVSALTWRLIEQRSLCWSRAIRLPQKNIAAAPVV